MKLGFLTVILVASASGGPWPNIPNALLEDWRQTERIVGGVETQPNEFPFQVSLQGKSIVGDTFSHRCGGTVVHQEWIVTAAHCVVGFGPSTLRVVAGEHSMAIMSGIEQFRDVLAVISHPSFDENTFNNDISLIRMTSPLDFSTGRVGAINIIEQGVEIPVGTMATVSGWGVLSDQSVQTPDKLHKATVPTMSHDRCVSSYGSFAIFPSMICAGYETGGVDACQGDSGGPLFLSDPDILIGIVSWGYGCAVANYPGVYTKVSQFTNWIRSVIEFYGRQSDHRAPMPKPVA